MIPESQGRTGVGVGAPTPLGKKGTPKEQAQTIVARIINLMTGAAHIVAKPRQIHNGTDIPKGPGEGAAETGGEGEETGTGGEGEHK